ncbi:MAG TPA: hypothetical protein VJV23_06275 [Candidatus Polarisedimenticolia bacterium]|nr:hypothetical protein [Candidatus Polarisedimenticolia bacterium]
MRWVERIVIVLAVAALGHVLPTFFFDDAYITFRYAQNIAAGEGFSYNPPERVLGVTTPLFTLLLAGLARLGYDLESAALWLGLAGHAALCVMAHVVLTAMRPPDEGRRLPVPLIGGTLCALQSHLALTAVGGMETSLYVALLLAVMAAAAAGSAAWTGVCLGAAFLTRPDAVLAVPAAFWLLASGPGGGSGERRTRAGGRFAVLRAAAVAAALALPWVLYAWLTFGSPVPHSVAAKRVIHPAGPLEILSEIASFIADSPLLLAALPLALWGLERRRREPLAQGLALFCLTYLAAWLFSGVTPFPWYVNPLIPPLLVLALSGLADVLDRMGLDRWMAWAAVAVALLGSTAWQLHRKVPELRASWDEWEGQYEIAARWIMNDSDPGDSVLVGEVGVIGYLLPGRVILDSSGINSPALLAMRRGRSETDLSWTRDVIETMHPDYITTSILYLNMRQLMHEEWFQSAYERIDLPLLDREGQVIFRRR